MLVRFTSAALGLAALAAVALGPGAARADDLKMLSPDQVQQLLGQPGVKIYDANPPDLWEKNHLPGAVFLGDRKLANVLPADKATKLVFYCAGPK